jgi:hypothetical protein
MLAGRSWKLDYDWTEDVRGLSMPVLIVAGDAAGLPARHAVEFFRLLGADLRAAVWDRSGLTHHGLAILPRITHCDVAPAPALATTAATFLDEDQAGMSGGLWRRPDIRPLMPVQAARPLQGWPACPPSRSRSRSSTMWTSSGSSSRSSGTGSSVGTNPWLR